MEAYLKNWFDVSGKIVLITGSSRGLGFSIAQGFADAGAKVVLNGTQREPLALAEKKIADAGGSAVGYAFDVTKAEEVQASIAAIEKEVGTIDVLVNNAGIQRRAPLEEMALADWQAVIDVNLTAVFVISQCVARGMIARKRGVIINISSLNAEGARPTIGNYCASKGGITMLTQSMATEWGQYNIRANAIGPGYFLTDLTRPLLERPGFDAWVKQSVPLGRWGDPSELIGTAIYLASDASSYITGRTIYVDGGWRAGL
jgi:gluconate 5-dehydrogenase